MPDDNKEAKEFFLDYEQPFKLLSLSHYENPVFNRYTVEVQKSIIDIEQLGHQVLQEEKSVLVILNTIQDTKDLYNFITGNMDDTNVLLLNTHFTPRDRSLKVYLAKGNYVKVIKLFLFLLSLSKRELILIFLYFIGILLQFQVLYNQLVVAIEMEKSRKGKSCCS